MKPTIPRALVAEHKELHAELHRAARAGGRTAAAARAVARLLAPHFAREEQFALPPLGLLAALATGRPASGTESAIAMSRRLKAELPRMLAEHRRIVKALRRLVDVASRERKVASILFAGKLVRHAQQEEQVLYPAAILVGEDLGLRLRMAMVLDAVLRVLSLERR